MTDYEEPQLKWLKDRIRQVEDDDLHAILIIMLARIEYLESCNHTNTSKVE